LIKVGCHSDPHSNRPHPAAGDLQNTVDGRFGSSIQALLDHLMNIGSARDLQNIMAVKGMKRGEQQKLLEAFGLPDSSGHSEISNQPSTNPFESDSNETMLSGSNQGQEEVKNREEEEEEKSLFERAQISFKSSINTAPLKNMMQRENSDNRSNTSAEEDEDEEEESVRKRILGSMKNLFD